MRVALVKNPSIESMRVTLVNTPSIGDTESEPAIFYNQASLPAVGLEQQPSHRTFDVQTDLPVTSAVIMVLYNLWEWPTRD